MERYTERVDSGLKELDAVSTGVCPGCDTCREDHGEFVVDEDDEREPGQNAWYVVTPYPGGTRKATEADYYRTEAEAEGAARKTFADAWSNCEVETEASFRRGGCGICNSPLGGNFEVWHWLDADGAIQHEYDACIDCVHYLANGTLPEGEE